MSDQEGGRLVFELFLKQEAFLIHLQYFCTLFLSPHLGTATTIVNVPRGGMWKTRVLSFMEAAYTQLSSCRGSWRLSSDCSCLPVPLPYSIYCDRSKKCLHSFALCNTPSFPPSKALTWRPVLPGKRRESFTPLLPSHGGSHPDTSCHRCPQPILPALPLQPSLAWWDRHRQGPRKSVPPPGRKLKPN